LLQRAIGEMTKHDDEQIFGDFVASSLRNLRAEVVKKRLKRKIQLAIIEMTDQDEELLYPTQNTPLQYNFPNLTSPASANTDSSDYFDSTSSSRDEPPLSSYLQNYIP
jgi:hypothetical protein